MSRCWTRATVVLMCGLAPLIEGQSPDRLEPGRKQAAETGGSLQVVLEGSVVDSDGAPAEGAVVVTSAGGKAVSDRNGSYRLEVRVPIDARSVQVTAVGRGGANLVASTSVELSASSALARVGPLSLGESTTCQPSWLPTFGEHPGVDDVVYTMAVFNDGDGPALYAGGDFMTAGGASALDIARWDGSSWSPLASGMGGANSQVLALTVFDDGSGPALLAGGSFTTAGGVAASRIARWDGSSWTTLGSGVDAAVNALTTFDDGNGPALFAGGNFTTAGGAAASYVARWDGSGWAPVGSGTNDTVFALAAFDDGSGAALYVGGRFTAAGGMAAFRIASWDGSSWAALGGMNGRIDALAVFDDGSGAALYAGGTFTTIGGVAAKRIARWDGSIWAALGGGTNGSVSALAAFDDGSGPALYAAGDFTDAGGRGADSIARWDAPDWSALGSGIGGVTIPFVGALSVFDDGRGQALYVGGSFETAGGVAASRIARWDGSSFEALGSGLSGTNSAVFALTVFDDGGGPALYAAGAFSGIGGVGASGIAKWNGSTWSALGSGVGGGLFSPEVYALTVFDDGSGPALYAGGDFTQAGGVAANRIARWNGSSWSALGGGLGSFVYALTAFDDGSGPALYAGGLFTTAGSVVANRIAKWDGSSWTALGSGVSGAFPQVVALTVFDDGSGPALHVGGSFTAAGGMAANSVAKWDGSSWAPLGSGMSGGTLNLADVNALTVFDDGSGSALYAGGDFTSAGLLPANRMARWDGTSWTPLGSGMDGAVVALGVFNDRTGPALYAGGLFTSALDSGDSYLAKWGCPDTNPPTISCPPAIVVDDRRNNGRGEILTFTVTAVDEEDPTPSLACVPPSGSLFPRGTTLVTCTATDFAGNQSTCQFPVSVRFKVRAP